MAYGCSTGESFGPFCDEESITEASIINKCLPKLSSGPKNGVVFELNEYRKTHGISWDDFYDWISQLCGDNANLCTLQTFKVYIGRLQKKVSKFKRNKQHKKMQSLMDELFCHKKKEPVPLVSSPVQKYDENTSNMHEIEILQDVNKKLAAELHTVESALETQNKETEKLCEKFSHLNVRNVNKRIKRRDEKIKNCQSQIKALVQEVDKKSEIIEKFESNCHLLHQKKEQCRVKSYRLSKKAEIAEVDLNKIQSKFEQLEAECGFKIKVLENEIIQLHAILDEKESANEQLHERLNEIDMKLLKTKEHKQMYLDNVRQCCIELLSLNVGIRQVEPVIRSVLKNIAGFEVDKLPQPGTLVRMYAEMKGLAYQQIAEELSEQTNLTLHSDGTSKYGQHYGSFQISVEGSVYTLGLSEMLTGSAEKTLDTLKQILDDIELVAGKTVRASLLTNIKNTMSDRHIVQKNFNELLESYRSEILPHVIASWKDLSSDEQQQVSSLNNFFCGLHLLVGMADTASSVLCHWEAANVTSTIGSGVIVQKSESGTVQLVRTACKVLSKHGSEQSGVYQSFTAFLLSHGVSKNPLASFQGNRFNILFYDAGALFYIATLVRKFFIDVWQTPNQLLRAVLADIQVPEYLAGCKALGLINKIITGLLWRVLESDSVSILDMNNRFQKLKLCLDQWTCDAMTVLCGEAILFDDFPPVKDAIFNSLIASSEYDATAQEILQTLFSALSLLVSRLVEDHLPEGKYDNPSVQLATETKSVPKTNVLSERDFAKLDRLLREKPNATTLCLEGMILFANNKTSAWLDSKTLEEKEDLMMKARSLAPEFKQLYKLRKKQLLEERSKILQAKQLQLEQLQQKKVREKEKLTESILMYGLWQSREQVNEELSKIKTKKEKLKALKAQLDFRKKVLEQTHSEKDLFFITKQSKQLPVEVICENLCKLLSSARLVSPPAALATNCHSLIGKEIYHKWKDEDGEERWYKGRVLSLVPGATEWYNVKYDGEDNILTLNLLSDIENGDLDII